MVGEQRLVGGDDVLALGDGFFHQRLRRAFGTADHLGHHIDVGQIGQRQRIIDPMQFLEVGAAILVAVARGDRHHLDRARTMQAQDLGILGQQLDDARADRAEAGDADLQRTIVTALIGHDRPRSPRRSFSFFAW